MAVATSNVPKMPAACLCLQPHSRVGELSDRVLPDSLGSWAVSAMHRQHVRHPCSHLKPIAHCLISFRAATDSLQELQQARWHPEQLPASQPAFSSSQSLQPIPPSTSPAMYPVTAHKLPCWAPPACLPAASGRKSARQAACTHTAYPRAQSLVKLSLCVPCALQDLMPRTPRQPTYSSAPAPIGLAGGLLSPRLCMSLQSISRTQAHPCLLAHSLHKPGSSFTLTGTFCLPADSSQKSAFQLQTPYHLSLPADKLPEAAASCALTSTSCLPADSIHKPGFKLHTRILHHLFTIVSSGVIKAPLWDAEAKGMNAYPSNAAFVQEFVSSLLATSFPNLRAQQIHVRQASEHVKVALVPSGGQPTWQDLLPAARHGLFRSLLASSKHM